MGTGISLDQAKEQSRQRRGWRSKHTQYDQVGRAVGSNTVKGKRAY